VYIIIYHGDHTIESHPNK